MPVGIVQRLGRSGAPVVNFGYYRPEVVLRFSQIRHKTDYTPGTIVLVQERGIELHTIDGHTVYEVNGSGYRKAQPIEIDGYRSPVTRLDLLVRDPENTEFLALGRWKDFIRDFGVFVRMKEEGIFLERMAALFYLNSTDGKSPDNLRRFTRKSGTYQIPNTQGMLNGKFETRDIEKALRNMLEY